MAETTTNSEFRKFSSEIPGDQEHLVNHPAKEKGDRTGGKNLIRKVVLSALGIILFGAIFYTGYFLGARSTIPSVVKIDVSVDDDASLGDPNAPVIIIEFSDYECPFCQRYFNQTFPLIKANFIDTGKVRYVFRDFPLNIHPGAQKAAEAAECAGEQGKYWEMHDMLFDNPEALRVGNYKRWAGELSLDQESFDTCLDSDAMAQEVRQDLKEGKDLGISGTPLFFVNGKPVSGARPYSVFESAIHAALAE